MFFSDKLNQDKATKAFIQNNEFQAEYLLISVTNRASESPRADRESISRDRVKREHNKNKKKGRRRGRASSLTVRIARVD